MGLSHSPKIVTNGLVMCLDAGNTKSYPGSGTTWFNLCGSVNGTLVNGPTFSSVNGGVIVLDGVNDYINTLSNSQYNYTTITISGWIKIPNYLNGGIQFIVNGNTTNALWSIYGDNLGFGNILNQGCSGFYQNNFHQSPLHVKRMLL